MKTILLGLVTAFFTAILLGAFVLGAASLSLAEGMLSATSTPSILNGITINPNQPDNQSELPSPVFIEATLTP